jgi:hypothetical protein
MGILVLFIILSCVIFAVLYKENNDILVDKNGCISKYTEEDSCLKKSSIIVILAKSIGGGFFLTAFIIFAIATGYH